jgi:hypothetical protein
MQLPACAQKIFSNRAHTQVSVAILRSRKHGMGDDDKQDPVLQWRCEPSSSN